MESNDPPNSNSDSLPVPDHQSDQQKASVFPKTFRDSHFLVLRRQAEAEIAAGTNVEKARAMLQAIDNLPPSTFPKRYPREDRMRELQAILDNPQFHKNHTNIRAIIEGYRSGELEYLEGHYYVFLDGVRVAGPRLLAEFDPRKVMFEEFPYPFRRWIERCTGPRYLLPSFSRTVYHDDDGHLLYLIRIRLMNSIVSEPILFMDDTGATNPTINRVDDLGSLPLIPSYHGWGDTISYQTANGVVQRDTIFLEAAFADIMDFPFFREASDYKIFEFAIREGYGGADVTTRLGGPLLRNLLFQGTVPDRPGETALSLHRTNLANLLR